MTHKENIPENSFVIHTRVENDNEILGKMPSWIIRYGMMLTGGILLLLFTAFFFYKTPYNITIRGNFYSTTEAVKNNMLSAESLKYVQDWIPAKGLSPGTCFLGEYSQQQPRLLKEGQHGHIKYNSRRAVADTGTITLRKIIFDTINKKTIILFDAVSVADKTGSSGLEIEVAQKNIFQLLF